MKTGDLVCPGVAWYQFVGLSAIKKIGIVIKVEKNFYTTNKDDRLTVRWMHGETTTEPDSYIMLLSDRK